MATRPQYPLHLSEEAIYRRIAKGRFDVDYAVETAIREGQVFGIAPLEAERVYAMPAIAELDSFATEIETHEAGGLQIARHIRGAAAAAAADFEHFATDDRRQRGDVVVKCDGITLRLV